MRRMMQTAALAAAALACMATASGASTVLEGATDGGALIKIEVPDDWNGGLVLYNHGFDLGAIVPSPPSLGPLAALQLSEGYAVVTADCGEAALARIEEHPVDVVLCDLRMPGIDGFELMPQIARQLPGVPIVLMSAYGTEDLAVEAMRRGAYDYRAKPFQPTEGVVTLGFATLGLALRRVRLVFRSGDVPLLMFFAATGIRATTGSGSPGTP